MLNVFKSKKFRFPGKHARYLSAACAIAGIAIRRWALLAFATGTVFAADAPDVVPADTSSDHDARLPGPAYGTCSSS